MPKLSPNKLPSYRLHKASGQAVVTLRGEDVYLGPWGTPASRKEYDRVTMAWVADGRPAGSAAKSGGLTVTELLLKYDDSLPATYENIPSGDVQIRHIKSALRIVRQVAGPTPAVDFGPLRLTAVQDAFVAAGWNRTYVNQQTLRVKRMFKWAISRELLPPTDKLRALDSVEGVRKGSKAPAPQKVRPVAEQHLQAAIDHTSPPVAAMLRLQRLTGMRGGEICMMRVKDLDMTGEVWKYTPRRHKTIEHEGVVGEIPLGPQAQEIIRPFLSPDLDAHLFRPSDAVAWRRKLRAEGRKTVKTYGNSAGTNRQRRPKKRAGDFYDAYSYRQAVAYACDAAFPLPPDLAPLQLPKVRGEETKTESIEAWKARLTPEQKQAVKRWRKEHRFHPHQVRHTAATGFAQQFGDKAAQTMLRHKRPDTTAIYIAENIAAARRIASQVG